MAPRVAVSLRTGWPPSGQDSSGRPGRHSAISLGLTHASSPRVSVPLLRTLDQMLAHDCFDVFAAEEE